MIEVIMFFFYTKNFPIRDFNIHIIYYPYYVNQRVIKLMDTIISYQMLITLKYKIHQNRNKNAKIKKIKITFYSENSNSATICFHIMIILRQDYRLT